LKTLNIPVWLISVVAAVFIILLAVCWWLSLSTYGGNCYDLGKRMERSQNPAKQYIEDGTPFLWYKGTYYRVQYVRPKVFRVLE
jgi:hypothetical protein